MTDGSSNAIVIGERYTPKNTSTSDFLTTLGAIGDATWVGALNDGGSSNGTFPNASATVTIAGVAGQACVLGEASYPINNGFNSTQIAPATTGFGSNHVGGCHFLMGDGTVRFISNNVNLLTYQYLSRINDGNPTGDF